MAPVTTMQIYKGAIPFLVLQLVMVAVLIAFPTLVTGGLDEEIEVDMKAVGEQMLQDLNASDQSADFHSAPSLFGMPAPDGDAAGGAAPAAEPAPAGDPGGLPGAGDGSSTGPVGGDPGDPMQAIRDAIGK